MNGAWDDRAHRYTKAIVEREAALGRAYHCEALYLDPGWDTTFGSFLWGEKWLGPRRQFIEEMKSKYGLQVSLHCPLATWVSIRGDGIPLFGPTPWGPIRPRPAARRPIPTGWAPMAHAVPGIEAVFGHGRERLLANCADGVAFLMFDGNWWNGGCLNPDHGHPVPYRMEDHIRANLDLAQRIHAKYPKVLIEMHDMLAGGARCRHAGLLQVRPARQLRRELGLRIDVESDGRHRRAGRRLYYANLGCNVPIYTHVASRDNPMPDLVVVRLDLPPPGNRREEPRSKDRGGRTGGDGLVPGPRPLLQTGPFYGITEEIHLHVLPRENAFTVNVFNLSDKKRTIRGTVN